MREMQEELVGVPPDVLPALHRIIHNLNTLTVLEQQAVLEMLVTRHVLRAGSLDRHRVLNLLADVLSNVAVMTKHSMEESRACQDQG